VSYESFSPPKTVGPSYRIQVLGIPRAPLRDMYHGLLLLSWPSTVAIVAGGFLISNTLFALGYWKFGGIHNAAPNSFLDAFYFSVQTIGTIGYGAMYPETGTANLLVVVESTVGLVLTALAAGLIFAKFSRPTARVIFSHRVGISNVDGVPTLIFRIGNGRSNRIVDGRIHIVLTRTEVTKEGRLFYRMVDVKLRRSRMPSLSRAWTVHHVIDEHSPLYGESAESLAKVEAELGVSVLGLDDTWMQTVHASHVYYHSDIMWGYHPVDILKDDGKLVTLDLTQFHDLERAEESDAGH
jgi:inward rectifier potassium channel